MESKIYPNIVFIKNQNLAFIGSHIGDMQELTILHPSDPLIQNYTSLVQKLFSEITILKQMLWICTIASTSIVRIYFSEPFQYPAAFCCQQPLFIQLERDLSGCFVCSKCKKIVTKFVYASENGGNDEELFKRKQKEHKSRKENLRELLTSQKFRAKNLKNNFLREPKLNEKGGFVMQINERSVCSQNSPANEVTEKSDQTLEELRSIINDIFA